MASKKTDTPSNSPTDRTGKQSPPESPLTKTKSSNSNVLEIDQFPSGDKNSMETPPKTTPTTSSESASGHGGKRKKQSSMPVPKDLPKQDRSESALRRLGVNATALALAPPLTAMLREDAKGAGGLKAVLTAIRFSSDDPDIAAFLQKYDKIPNGDKEKLPWEAISLAAGVNPTHLLGAIHVAVQRYSASRVKFIISMGHPKTAAARVRFAQMPAGNKDRDAIDTMTGALPTAKGPTFIGKANIFGSGPPAASGGDDDDDDGDTKQLGQVDDYDSLFPDSRLMQEKLVAIRQKLLE